MRESRVCDSMFAYKAVWVLWSVAATCTLPMTAVADVGAEAPAVALFSTHRLRHCQETDAGRRQRTRGIHLRSVQRALRVHLRLSGQEQRQDSDVSLKSRPLTTIHVLPELVHVWGGVSWADAKASLSACSYHQSWFQSFTWQRHGDCRPTPPCTATALSVRPLSHTGLPYACAACILTNVTFSVEACAQPTAHGTDEDSV